MTSIPTVPLVDTTAMPVQRAVRRADIQGLRALAVTIVVIYHFFPTTIPGGFVGVDVFFVISGYLITLLLIREVERTGTISLSSFYRRRVRRLMPAAIGATVATVAGAALLVGPVRLVSTLRDAAWTSAYLANVHFGMNPEGYFATSEPSPFLHFWSLAVEEQYYILWPALLLLTLYLARGRVLAALPYLLGVILASSLAASIALTASGSTHAYYSLATRAWELAIGGAVAVTVSRRITAPGRRMAAAMTSVGLLAIVAACVAFSEFTPFPGWRAGIPTVGTALVIWAGTYHRGFLDRFWRLRPVQFVGDSSYSLYLWHWPVLVLGSVAIGNGRSDRLMLVVLAIALGSASYLVIEQGIGRLGSRWSTPRTLGTAAAVTLLVVVAPIVTASLIPITAGAAVSTTTERDLQATISGGRVELSPAPTLEVPGAVPANVTPALDALPEDLAEVFGNGCYADGLVVCEGGDPEGVTRIVLAGDSHAGQWWPAVDAAAREHGWKLYLVGKNGCALADVPISKGATSEAWPECTAWQVAATAAVVDLDADLILYANHAQGYSSKLSLSGNFEALWTEGVDHTLEALAASAPVLLFGQSPVLSSDPATCLSEHLTDVRACSTARDTAVRPEIRRVVEGTAARDRVTYFDPATLLCTDVCGLMDQNIISYRDQSHITKTYSLLLTEAIGNIIGATLAE